jgi:DNA replication protein DnaC
MRTLNPELVAALKRLKLSRIADTLPERLVLADKQDMPVEDLLLLLLSDEISRRDNSAAERRANDARLDPKMRFELFDKSAKVSYDKQLLNELVSLRFIEKHRHIVILGPVGVGKTFVATALGHVACQHSYRVKFTRADTMLRSLRQGRFDSSRDDAMMNLLAVDLLILDDFAIEAMTKEESKDVYQLFLERTGSASMIITSNRDTSEWLAMFDDMLLAQSAVDRVKNSAYDLVIDGESYRPKLKPKLGTDDAPPRAPVPTAKAAPRSRTHRRH